MNLEKPDQKPTWPTPPACPKCGQKVIAPESCPFCGIVFNRYRPTPTRDAPKKATRQSRSIAPFGIREMGIYARFFRQMSRMLGAGRPLVDSLEQVKQAHPRLHIQVDRVIDAIDRGHTMVEGFALAGAKFPSFVWGHLEAGEVSGHLEELFEDLANELTARRKWILSQLFNFRTLWLLAMFAFAALSLAITNSVRQLTPEIVDRGEAAVLTAIGTGATSRFFVYGLLITLAVLLFAWFQIKGKQHLTQRLPWMEQIRLHMPLFGQITRLESWRRYLQLLAKMFESGMPLATALRLAQADIEFPAWQRQFSILQSTLDQGGTLAQGFKQIPFVPKTLAVEVQVGEQTGTLSESLRRDATLMAETVQRLRNLVLVVFLVASIILGIILTIFVFVRGLGAWIPIYEKVLYS